MQDQVTTIITIAVRNIASSSEVDDLLVDIFTCRLIEFSQVTIVITSNSREVKRKQLCSRSLEDQTYTSKHWQHRL